MDVVRAKEMLQDLADGVNPLTGELLSGEDSCNQVEVVRALHTILAELNKKTDRKKSLPENAGKPWSEEMDRTLSRMFDEGYSKKQMCDHFKRTRGSIGARLVFLGKIQRRDDFRDN